MSKEGTREIKTSALYKTKNFDKKKNRIKINMITFEMEVLGRNHLTSKVIAEDQSPCMCIILINLTKLSKGTG